ncbi:MAG TPA: pyrimidine dimer DNA glycosylase/endonuclease V [Candidatus Woesearchaeota archaeon]|nr:pyrimidine dimer DNA glycosylase/endonuclease V [Candidatus Woesearchaeota archaeon]
MVRVNLISPNKLSDQHLIAEYDEILMLLGYVKRFPAPIGIPKKYTLGKGHMKFFKDKLLYLKKRHESIKSEMKKRDFKTNITIDLLDFPKELVNDWAPDNDAIKKIKERLVFKLKLKPWYYRYYGENKNPEFFLALMD